MWTHTIVDSINEATRGATPAAGPAASATGGGHHIRLWPRNYTTYPIYGEVYSVEPGSLDLQSTFELPENPSKYGSFALEHMYGDFFVLAVPDKSQGTQWTGVWFVLIQIVDGELVWGEWLLVPMPMGMWSGSQMITYHGFHYVNGIFGTANNSYTFVYLAPQMSTLRLLYQGQRYLTEPRGSRNLQWTLCGRSRYMTMAIYDDLVEDRQTLYGLNYDGTVRWSYVINENMGYSTGPTRENWSNQSVFNGITNDVYFPVQHWDNYNAWNYGSTQETGLRLLRFRQTGTYSLVLDDEIIVMEPPYSYGSPGWEAGEWSSGVDLGDGRVAFMWSEQYPLGGSEVIGVLPMQIAGDTLTRADIEIVPQPEQYDGLNNPISWELESVPGVILAHYGNNTGVSAVFYEETEISEAAVDSHARFW